MSFVIIPVSSELDNGNLPALLANLAQQTVPATPVFIINNSQADADYTSPIYKENRRTLSWLKQNAPDAVVVDRTAGLERNMGRIRNLGLAAARETGATADTPLIAMDADCRFSSRFVDRIEMALRKNPFSIQPLLYFPDVDDPWIQSTFFEHHLPLLGGECVRLLCNLPTSRLGAPQIAATAGLWATAGGFPELVDGEDFAAGRLMGELAGIRFLADPEALVLTADRVTGHGFESAARGNRKRDGGGCPSPADNPLFHFAAAIAATDTFFLEEERAAASAACGVQLPRLGSAADDGYQAAMHSGIPPLSESIGWQITRLEEIGNALFPNFNEKCAALNKGIRKQYTFPGDFPLAEVEAYYQLASMMLYLMRKRGAQDG